MPCRHAHEREVSASLRVLSCRHPAHHAIRRFHGAATTLTPACRYAVARCRRLSRDTPKERYIRNRLLFFHNAWQSGMPPPFRPRRIHELSPDAPEAIRRAMAFAVPFFFDALAYGIYVPPTPRAHLSPRRFTSLFSRHACIAIRHFIQRRRPAVEKEGWRRQRQAV